MFYAKPNRGTGGAGAQGILQGLIAGQQSKANDQRMEAFQTQMDNQREDRAKQEFNGAMFNMELGGSPDEVNNVMAKYPDLYLDKNPLFEQQENDFIPFNTDANQYLTTRFKRLNSKELNDQYGATYNEDGSINMQHLNKLQELRPDVALTEEMFSDPAKYEEYINNGFVMEEQLPDGKFSDILMTPEMFEAGSAGYASYKRKRLQDEALTKAKLDSTTKGPNSAYMQVFSQWQNATEPNEKKILKNQLDHLSLDKPTELVTLMDMRDNIDPSKPENLERINDINKRIKKLTEFAPQKIPSAIIVDKYEDEKAQTLGESITKNIENFDVSKPITATDTSLETKVRGDKSRYNTKLQTLEDEAKSSQRTIETAKNLQTLMNDPKFASGPLDNVVTYLSKITPDELMKTSTEQIMADASINQFTAQVLKDLSGLAASDSEAYRTLLQTVGDPNMQESVRQQTIANFIKNTSTNLKNQATQLGQSGLNVTAKTLIQSLIKEKQEKTDAEPAKPFNPKYLKGAK